MGQVRSIHALPQSSPFTISPALLTLFVIVIHGGQMMMTDRMLMCRVA